MRDALTANVSIDVSVSRKKKRPRNCGRFSCMSEHAGRSKEPVPRESYCLVRAYSARITASEFCGITFGQHVDQLLMEIVVSCRNRWGYSFIVHLARTIDVFAQAIIEIAFAPAFFDLWLVIKFDFRNQ